VNARLTSSTLTLRFHIETTGGVQFQPLLSPDNVCNSPATVRPIIQRIGDDMTLGKGPDYRFWGPPITLADGGVDVTVPLAPDQWINVNGQYSPAGFAEALAKVWRIGVTFGGGCFAGHGVNISGGTAKFTMTAFNLN
jgi:hypothetical protein